MNNTMYCQKEGMRYCEYDDIVHDDMHFCSYGERKEK